MRQTRYIKVGMGGLEKGGEGGGWTSRELLKGGITIEITQQSRNEMQIRVSPLHEFTRFVSCQPTLEQGEFVTFKTATKSRLTHCADSLAQEESFFAYNAMDVRSGCTKCYYGRHQQKDISVMAWQEEAGSQRELRYHCKRRGNLAASVKSFPLPACPIPAEIFKDRILQSGVPILARGIPAENQADME